MVAQDSQLHAFTIMLNTILVSKHSKLHGDGKFDKIGHTSYIIMIDEAKPSESGISSHIKLNPKHISIQSQRLKFTGNKPVVRMMMSKHERCPSLKGACYDF